MDAKIEKRLPEALFVWFKNNGLNIDPNHLLGMTCDTTLQPNGTTLVHTLSPKGDFEISKEGAVKVIYLESSRFTLRHLRDFIS